MSKTIGRMSEAEIRNRITELAFDGDALRFREFLKTLQAGLPAGTGIAFRGSVVTNERWEDGEPFDSKGRGSSDLDVTLVGEQVMALWEEGFYIPALHTKPLSDEQPQIAPALAPLRERLQKLAGRPVNFQATANLILFARDVLLGEPYVMLIQPGKSS